MIKRERERKRKKEEKNNERLRERSWDLQCAPVLWSEGGSE